VGAKSARIASAQEVERATGFAPGAVAPFPLAAVETVVLEQMLLRHAVVWVGGGSPNHMVGLSPWELARLARARAMDVVQPHPYDSSGDFAGDSTGDRAADDPGDRRDPDEPKER
jgi:prolyl-tRNA editing enzyme YbaK/EbsC (Cys-tRNA(Pro) deacylase)